MAENKEDNSRMESLLPFQKKNKLEWERLKVPEQKWQDMNPQYFPMPVKFKQVVISTTCNDYSASAKLTVQKLLLRNISYI